MDQEEVVDAHEYALQGEDGLERACSFNHLTLSLDLPIAPQGASRATGGE
jgi:hypothetical protein